MGRVRREGAGEGGRVRKGGRGSKGGGDQHHKSDWRCSQLNVTVLSKLRGYYKNLPKYGAMVIAHSNLALSSGLIITVNVNTDTTTHVVRDLLLCRQRN